MAKLGDKNGGRAIATERQPRRDRSVYSLPRAYFELDPRTQTAAYRHGFSGLRFAPPESDNLEV